MSAPAASRRPSPRRDRPARAVDFEVIWNSVPTPCAILDREDRFLTANAAAELYFSQSLSNLRRMSLADFCGENSRLSELAQAVRRSQASRAEYGVELLMRDREGAQVDLHAAPLHDHTARAEGAVLLMIQPRSVAAAMNRSLTGQGSARSLSGLAAMLAHEIKNPLSGISGAAQLLEMKLGDAESELLRLIHEEVDRIRDLLDRVDFFGDSAPTARLPVNVHDVLNQARSAAAAGFARELKIIESYDPSLPPIAGDRALLLQAVTNLLKNAAEAAPTGEVTLRTAFRPGIKIAMPGGARESLPLEVSVIDNGPGVPEGLLPHIFEPFVTSKAAGTGLGLATAAKIVADHGGVIECVRQGARTVFRMRFPVWQGGDPPPA